MTRDQRPQPIYSGADRGGRPTVVGTTKNDAHASCAVDHRTSVPGSGRWEIFCRVVDHFGDIGVCWRLARMLVAEHHKSVRLWVDDLTTFARLSPTIRVDLATQIVEGVEVRRWPVAPTAQPSRASAAASAGAVLEESPPEVLIEAFACTLPADYIDTLACQPQRPVWINLEYLTAEAWIEDCHRQPSPQQAGWVKYFFFPGFTPYTGGLLREHGLLAARNAFQSDPTAQQQFWTTLAVRPPRNGELQVFCFCYANTTLPSLLSAWSRGTREIRLFTAPGPATEITQRWLAELPETEVSAPPTQRRGQLTIQSLPMLTHQQFDQLLWACDANFVRGEDSFVRAQWAGRPFLWQIYPQLEDAHWPKLAAFLDRYLADCPAEAAVRRLWEAWNRGSCPPGQTVAAPPVSPALVADAWEDFVAQLPAINHHQLIWATRLDQTENLANNLVRFVEAVRSGAGVTDAEP